MDRDKEFYIGWRDKTPSSSRNLIKMFILAIFTIGIISSVLIVYFQKPFNQHQFTFGNLAEVEGILHKFPKPILEINSGDANIESKYVLLVGYGKFGTDGIIAEMEKENGDLAGKRIKLIGSPIKGDGKSLLELSKKKESLLQVYDDTTLSPNSPSPKINVTLSGEIIDPKCYFGVMKPGEGKIHKSCAIRCISGGIPAVFKSADSMGFKYSIILGENGEGINEKLLDYVAEKVTISGFAYTANGWDVIQIDPKQLDQ